jgi:hypothetical protein
VDRSTPVLCSLHSDLSCLIRCVHDSPLWTQTIVPTKGIILTHTLEVHTVGIGRLRMRSYFRVQNGDGFSG